MQKLLHIFVIYGIIMSTNKTVEDRMKAVECIKTRRSVRKFKDQAVSTDVIAEIVNVAAYAPSWKNSQTGSIIGK